MEQDLGNFPAQYASSSQSTHLLETGKDMIFALVLVQREVQIYMKLSEETLIKGN